MSNPTSTPGSPATAPGAHAPAVSATRRPSRATPWIASLVLLAVVLGAGWGLALWKRGQLEAQASAVQPEPLETITAADVGMQPYQLSTTAIGTLLALRSITLRNEEAGTVAEVHLESGAVVEAGDLLVALDVSVEEAELHALEAQAALAKTLLDRIERASQNQGASEADVDRARAERDVALANLAGTQAVIQRKTIHAPFRASIGLSDVHVGQYLSQGTALTTLQGVDDAVYVDFSVTQDVAASLAVGQQVTVLAGPDSIPVEAGIVALDARVDVATRNAMVRAKVPQASQVMRPGSAVRVKVPLGNSQEVAMVPVNALRKGPGGDHVFVLQLDDTGTLRAHERRVESGAMLGDLVVIRSGLKPGERVAASGSFKLFEGVRVNVAAESAGQGQGQGQAN